MEELAAYVVFILATIAIALSVILAAVFCIGICELATWMWTRLHPEVRHENSMAVAKIASSFAPLASRKKSL